MSRLMLRPVGTTRSIANERGRTVIIVSHDARIKEIADRVLWSSGR